jgi:hypothetical protein
MEGGPVSTIWKFELAVVDEQAISMPRGAVVLDVQAQRNTPCVWVQVEPDEPLVERTFYTHGTGHTVDAKAGRHLGTYQLHGGGLIFHVFAARST